MGELRGRLAQVITWLVVVLAVLAVLLPSALPVMDVLIPVLMLVLGFYFGQRTGPIAE